MECTRWHKNQQAYLEVIWKENKTDDVICLHFGVYGNICGHMIPSSGMAITNNENCYVYMLIIIRKISRSPNIICAIIHLLRRTILIG